MEKGSFAHSPLTSRLVAIGSGMMDTVTLVKDNGVEGAYGAKLPPNWKPHVIQITKAT